MKRLHYHISLNNFGDMITPYVVKKLGFNGTYSPADDNPHYMLAGSILKDANSNTTVLGAGFGAADQRVSGSPTVKLVRGQLTADILAGQGIIVNQLGDPGMCLPNLYKPQIDKTHRMGVIPHYVDLDHATGLYDGLIINPFWPVEQFIDAILSCETTISSSLHGLIVSHAYGVPCQWVKFSDKIDSPNDFKYHDYFTSVGIKQNYVDCTIGIPTNLAVLPFKGRINQNVLTIIRRGLTWSA